MKCAIDGVKTVEVVSREVIIGKLCASVSKKTIWIIRANYVSLYVYVFIMDTKLTLKLDKFVIEQAKEYASSQNRSLSRIIESYLKSLINRENLIKEDDIKISPFVKSMSTGIKIPADLDYKSEILNHLEEKHK